MVRRGSLDADVDEGTRGDVLVLWRGEVYELSLAGAAAQHLRVLLGGTLDDRSLDEADAAHVACERGPLDHDFEPFETIGDDLCGHVHLGHLGRARARPGRENECVRAVVRGH